MGIVSVYLTPILTVLVSIIYFRMSPKEQRLHTRLAVSGHGVAIAVLYCGAILVSRFMRLSPATKYTIHDIKYTIHDIWSYLLIVPVIFIFFALMKFRGPLLVHLLQIINMMGLVWTLLLGSMFLTDQWL